MTEETYKAIREGRAKLHIEQKQKAIIDHYGADKQLDMLVEECAELIQAIQKYKRYKDIPGDGEAFDNLIEEIADVENIIDQIKLLKLYDPVMARADIEGIKAKKVRRQLERIALESEYKINTESDNYENRDQ